LIINEKPELSDNNVELLLHSASWRDKDEIAKLILNKKPELSDSPENIPRIYQLEPSSLRALLAAAVDRRQDHLGSCVCGQETHTFVIKSWLRFGANPLGHGRNAHDSKNNVLPAFSPL